jgi:MFS family permease
VTSSPTRVRYSIVAAAVLINVVSYSDRACIAVVGPELRRAFNLSPAELGLVFGSFSLAYAMFQAPWGALADRKGARGVVSFAIFWWSAFAALTAAAWNAASLVVLRFLFGAGESALSPAVASAFNRWVPLRERATAFGAFLGGGRLGGALAPPLAALLVATAGWRAVFVCFALAGLPAALLWRRSFREAPHLHPRVNEAEAELVARGCEEEGPLPELRSPRCSAPLLCLLGVAFGYTFMWQFYITWFPTYLTEFRKLPLGEASFYAGLPLAFGVAANWAGGLLTDAFGRRVGPRAARTVVGFAGLLASAGLVAAGTYLRDARVAALLLASAAFAGDLFLAAGWASALSIGGKAGGAAAGLMNSVSNLAGFVSPTLMGLSLQTSHDWSAVLTLAFSANAVAALLWLGVNPRRCPSNDPGMAEVPSPAPTCGEVPGRGGE